jgi:hypothetical protein
MKTVTTTKVGDWVRVPSLWPGIWKVSRVLAGFSEDRWSLDEPLQPSQRSILFCHRMVNDSWKRSFSYQCCEAALTRTLSDSEQRRIETLLTSDKRFVAAFEKYQATTKTIDLIANLGFGGLGEDESGEFPSVCDKLLADRIEDGLTMDDVLGLLRSSWLDSHRRRLPQQVTLQLIATGHEVRDGRFVYRRYRSLAH